MDNSWVKLYRKIIDHEILHDPNGLKVFIWLLTKVDKITGKTTISRFKSGEFLRLNPNTFYSVLQRLEKKHKIINIKSNNKFTEISLLNWAKYQSANLVDNTLDNNATTTRQQRDNTYTRIENKKREYIYNGKAQIKKYTTDDLEESTRKLPIGELNNSFEWQEKASRYAAKLGIDLEIQGIKPRWYKIFKDAHKGIRTIDLEKATSYLIDYPRKLPPEEKLKLFFWIYMNNKEMKEGYVTTS